MGVSPTVAGGQETDGSAKNRRTLLVVSVGMVVPVSSNMPPEPIKMEFEAANCLCFPAVRNSLASADSS